MKFIGDASLCVWPETRANEGVEALLELKRDVDAWLAGLSWDSRLIVKAHLGPLVAGPIGPRGLERFDVIGTTVNVAASLEARTVSISPQAFRRLTPAMRRRFKKHTPRVVYIPTDDARP